MPWERDRTVAALAQYTFFAWIRRGISAHQKLVAGARATVDIEVTTDGIVKPVALELFGPADITGFDSRAVIRVWPQPGARNAEPNYFPLIEFAQPDLPWRYTPATAAGDRMAPWLCLVVLKADPTAGETLDYRPATATRPLPVLRASRAALPDLSQSAVWAHTQRDGSAVANDGELATRLAAEPARFLSRILSTPRMVAETEYRAFLVPAFEGSRLAGLGASLEGKSPIASAWTAAQAEVLLPVYFEWSFHTGPEGDFPALVKKIRPQTLPAAVGVRDMDVSQPGMGLPAAFDGPLRQDGALAATVTERTNWIGAARNTFVQKLRELLNLPEALKRGGAVDPVVAPPLYGRWPGAQVEDTAASPSWFQQLNDDPRRRVAAGAGTDVVRRDQQALLAAAWDQVPALRQANDALRQSQLGTEILVRIRDRIFAATQSEALFRVTAPLHAKVLHGATTIRRSVIESPIAESLFEPQFQRLTRALGPLGRRQARAARPASDLVERMNRGDVMAAAPPATPAELPTARQVGQKLLPSWATPGVIAFFRQLPTWLVVAALLIAVLAVVIPGALALLIVGVAAAAAAPLVRARARDLSTRAAFRDEQLTGEQVQQIRFPSGFVPVELGPGVWRPVPVKTAPGTEQVAAENFRTAAAAVFAELARPVAEAPPLREVSLAAMRQTLTASLDPRVTVAAAIQDRLRVPPDAFQPGPAAPVVLAPQFDTEMYAPLRNLSQDWILPGLDLVKPDSASLVETNQDFIEAYMVGVNHEMARTLLFNEFPADLRATYFRQFWRSAGAFGATQNPEELRDITAVVSWPAGSALGAHTARRRAKHLVLMIRGEVLRRYPNTMVYAAPAIRDAAGKRVITDDESKYRSYVISGDLNPDVRFFGFELEKDEAKGGGANAGWFFVLQQHPQEPLFGLQANAAVTPGSFKELAWSQVAVAAGGITATRHLDLSLAAATPVVTTLVAAQPASGPQWSKDAANFAASTLRQPVRVAYHASAMLKDI